MDRYDGGVKQSCAGEPHEDGRRWVETGTVRCYESRYEHPAKTIPMNERAKNVAADLGCELLAGSGVRGRNPGSGLHLGSTVH